MAHQSKEWFEALQIKLLACKSTKEMKNLLNDKDAEAKMDGMYHKACMYIAAYLGLDDAAQLHVCMMCLHV